MVAKKGHKYWDNPNSIKTQFKKGHKHWNHPNAIKTRFKKGMIPWTKGMKGIHFSPKTEFKKGIIPWNKGKKVPKMQGKNNPFYNKKHTKESLKKILKRRRPSGFENDLINLINKHNLPYKYVGDGGFILNGLNPDFINCNGEKIAIEVYSDYYKLKNHKSIKKWKEERQRIFSKYGWKIIFLDETQVNEENVLRVINHGRNF